MRSLKKWFRRLWDKFPSQPLLYVCSHNGVTGVVRAEDFDDEVRLMRQEFEKNKWPDYCLRDWEVRPVRPQVWPIFLFSDKDPGSRSFRVGTLKELYKILEGCRIEERSFELPPLNAPGMARAGYHGGWNEIGRENSRHVKWSLNQAETYFHGGEISYWVTDSHDIDTSPRLRVGNY